MDWTLPIILASIGFFFVIMTYGALYERSKGRNASGVPGCGGIFLFAAFILSPVKWLALLCLIDYGIVMLPYILISEYAFSKKNDKAPEDKPH